MKLEVGMYVRTKLGIFKIRKITKDLAYWKHEKRVLELDKNIPEYNYRFSFYKDESIFKGAKFKDNIIDLIEVGDYVNGERVIALKNDISERNIHMNSKGNSIFVDYDLANDWYYGIDDEEIKSIVTKEQFESIKYSLEG